MGEDAGRLGELEALSAKVYQAKELIGRLKQSNRELSSRLEEIKRRVGTQEPAPLEETPPSSAGAPDSGSAHELDRLRLERREIRERVSRLLEQIESLS